MNERDEKLEFRKELVNAIYLKAVEALDHLLECAAGGLDAAENCPKCRELLKDYALLRCSYGKF